MEPPTEKLPTSPLRPSARSLSPFFCDFHEEQIFNFCLNLECLRPLCPECIKEHQYFHEEKNSKPEFTTLKAVKSSCVKKIDAGINSLSHEVKKCEVEFLLDPQTLIESGMKKLRKMKERLFLMVESHCAAIEETLRRRAQENVLKGSDFEGIFQEIGNIIKELEFLKKNLDSSSGLNYIKKVCMLDLKALMKEFKSKVKNVIKTKDLEPTEIHIDESRFGNFKADLESMIYIHSIHSEGKNIVESSVNHENANAIKSVNNSYINPSYNQSQAIFARNSNNELQHSHAEMQNEKEAEPNSSKFKLNAQQNHPKPPLVSTVTIDRQDFFDVNARKTLHFFQKNKKILHILDLNTLSSGQELSELNFKKYHLQNELPGSGKSIALPSGGIYLIGGQVTSNSSRKCAEIYRFYEREVTIKQVSELNHARANHGLCCLDHVIYIIGGCSSTGLCVQNEKFNVSSKKCTLLNDKMHVPVANPGLCVFANDIYKFGGLESNQTLSQKIEKLDLDTEMWEIVNFLLPSKEQLLMSPTCAQINSTQMLVIGGEDADERPSSQVLLFQPSSKLSEPSVFIELAAHFTLPFPFGFVQNEGTCQDGQFFFLQNKEEGNAWNEDRKNVLVLNGKEWNLIE